MRYSAPGNYGAELAISSWQLCYGTGIGARLRAFAGGTNLASQPTVFVASISDPESCRLLKTRFAVAAVAAVAEVADKF
ncbi:MAG: hypothetical protein Q8R44_06100 [Novosphingobium sp.]|nr:hypothetical protein [Novosphingobium sp.]